MTSSPPAVTSHPGRPRAWTVCRTGLGLGLLLWAGPGIAAALGPTPTVRGAAEVGQNLEASVEGRPPSRWSWLRCSADGDDAIPSPDVLGRQCAPVEGAASALYVVRDSDAGYRLRAVASYADGAAPSLPTAVVRRLPASNVAPPSLASTGAPAVGTTLTWTVGRWANTATLDVIV